MSTNFASKFERTILDTIEKNLHQLILEFTKLQDMLAHGLNEDVDLNMFDKTIKRSVENCRRLMGNLEILPNPSDLKRARAATEGDEIVLRVIASIDDKGWGRREEIEKLFIDGRLEKGLEMLLEKMLRFLAEMPVDRYHDYREFRHKGLRGYLINRFIREKWHEQLATRAD
jgi:hypothetical protein